MGSDLKNWTPRARPDRRILKGSRVHLTPASTKNTEALFDLISLPGEEAI